MNNNSTLTYMLDLQKEFQMKVGYDFSKMDIKEKGDYCKEMILWCSDELHEMLHELPFAKGWSKKYESWDDEKIKEQIQLSKEELIDALLFMLNIFDCLEMTEEDILREFNKKHKLNIDRQNSGY